MTQTTRPVRPNLVPAERGRAVSKVERIPAGISLTLALFVTGLMWLAIALSLQALLA